MKRIYGEDYKTFDDIWEENKSFSGEPKELARTIWDTAISVASSYFGACEGTDYQVEKIFKSD